MVSWTVRLVVLEDPRGGGSHHEKVGLFRWYRRGRHTRYDRGGGRVNARKSGKPVILRKAKDGATTMLISSTGSSTTTSPERSVRWQHCTGFWTVNADKSGSGSGNCYAFDGDGDQWTISWEGANAGGTWAHASGSGKYADRSSAKGTWKPGGRFADGTGLRSWEGDCGD